VSIGADAGSSLTINGVENGAFNVYKQGLGTLTLGGSAPNVNGAWFLNQGTLVLNKSGGVAVAGQLVRR